MNFVNTFKVKTSMYLIFRFLPFPDIIEMIEGNLGIVEKQHRIDRYDIHTIIKTVEEVTTKKILT